MPAMTQAFPFHIMFRDSGIKSQYSFCILQQDLLSINYILSTTVKKIVPQTGLLRKV